MDQSQQAIVAIAAMTPLALGLYIYGRWRRGEFSLPRDGLVVAGTILWALVLVAAFAGPPAAILLVPPVGLLVGGVFLWRAGSGDRLARIGAVLATALGLIGLIAGTIRLVFQ
jgi:hypothetical protein